MVQFKSLQWSAHKDMEGIYATIDGFDWRYSIIAHKNEKVELALLDANFEYISGFPEFCTSISQAQEKATKHYTALLQNLVVG